ncbi:MAG: universal stress protein [Spirochaetaceae bacterium]|nr:universal stress protein [Spirochaetaceae bacterium]
MKSPLSELLVVITGAESSIEAAKYAIAVSRHYGSRITAVYVVDTATIRQLALSRIFVPEEGEEYERSLEESGRRYLQYAEELAKEKRFHIQTRLLKGSIAGEVIKAAEDIGADCIVIGGGDSGSAYRDAIVESYREIVRSAPCPILVVRGVEADKVYRAL